MGFKPGLFITSIIWLLSIPYSTAQIAEEKKSIDWIVGIGNYEYLHTGINLTFKNKFYIETALGIKPWDFSTDRYMMVYVSAGIPFLKTYFSAKKIKPFLQIKGLLWDIDNEYNHFMVIGVGPELRLLYDVNKRMKIVGNIGVMYNSILKYERKTYKEVGWPIEFPPTFSLQWTYRINP